MTCVSCGSRSNIEIDHKNDLYNDPRVWDLYTQTLDDFQPLCKHFNDQKRQIVKKMKETNKRYGATNIPMLKCFGIDYIKGDETFDLNDHLKVLLPKGKVFTIKSENDSQILEIKNECLVSLSAN